MSKAENDTSGPPLSSGPLITSAAMVGTGTVLVLAGLLPAGTPPEPPSASPCRS